MITKATNALSWVLLQFFVILFRLSNFFSDLRHKARVHMYHNDESYREHMRETNPWFAEFQDNPSEVIARWNRDRCPTCGSHGYYRYPDLWEDLSDYRYAESSGSPGP